MRNRYSLFIILALLTVFFQEFSTGGIEYENRIIYTIFIGPFRLMDLIILVIFSYVLLRKIFNRNIKFKKNKTNLFLVGIYISVLCGLIIGALNNGNNLFYDWKGLFLGTLIYIILNEFYTYEDKNKLIKIFLTLIAINNIFILLRYVTGNGVRINSLGYTTVFNGVELDYLVFSCIVLFSIMIRKKYDIFNKKTTNIFFLLELLVIVTSFRRSTWALLIVGLLMSVFYYRKYLNVNNLIRIITGLVLALFIGFLALTAFSDKGINDIVARLSSFNITQNNEYSNTNKGHVDDIVEGFNQIKKHSFFWGSGLGIEYETELSTKDWKDVSVGVHNGFIDIWLKYGIIGLASFTAMFLYLMFRKENDEINYSLKIFIVIRFFISFTFINYTQGSYRENFLLFFILWSINTSIRNGEIQNEDSSYYNKVF